MRIDKISAVNSLNHVNSKSVSNNIINSVNPKSDSVSFKSFETSLTLLVAKDGYKALKNDSAKIKFKNQIFDILKGKNVNDIINAIFALAKSPTIDAPKSFFYKMKCEDLNLWYEKVKALDMFPDIPEMKGDSNSGHAAKMALMSNMIESGDYIRPIYTDKSFYNAFKNLPPMYDAEKEILMKKALSDKNVLSGIMNNIVKPRARDNAESAVEGGREFTPLYLIPVIGVAIGYAKERMEANSMAKDYIPVVASKVENERAIANTALLSTMDSVKHAQFFNEYKDKISAQAQKAFRFIDDRLHYITSYSKYKNYFYGFYKSGYDCYRDMGEWGLRARWDISEYERVLTHSYFMEFMEYLKGDKNAIMERFNIDEVYYDDLVKDHELLSKIADINDEAQINDLVSKRVDEKFQSDNEYVKESAGGLCLITHAHEAYKHFRDLKEKYNCYFESFN